MTMIFIFLLFSPHLVSSLGRHNFECPDGFYLNILNSIFGNEHRMYSFGCAPLKDGELSDEKCVPGKISASNSNDMYMTCDNNQYVAGVSIIEDSTHQMWTLLCCQSPDVQISNECSSTVFLNEYQKSFSFAGGAKHILRKWQSVYDNQKKDRRWWLQTCPFSLVKSPINHPTDNQTEQSINFNRKVGFPFEENRMEVRLSPKKLNSSLINEHSIDEKPETKKINKVTSDNQTYHYDNSTMTILRKLTSLSVQSSTTKRSETSTIPLFRRTSPSLGITKPSTAVINSSSSTSTILGGAVSTSTKISSYEDYYDSNGSSHIEKQTKNENKSDSKLENIFKGLHKVFKNIQDGLVLAQWVLSNDDEEANKPVKSSNNVQQLDNVVTEKVSFSRDEGEKTKISTDNSKKQKTFVQHFAEFMGICNPSPK